MKGWLDDLATIRPGRSGRHSSWDETGRNNDAWSIAPGVADPLAQSAPIGDPHRQAQGLGLVEHQAIALGHLRGQADQVGAAARGHAPGQLVEGVAPVQLERQSLGHALELGRTLRPVSDARPQRGLHDFGALLVGEGAARDQERVTRRSEP